MRRAAAVILIPAILRKDYEGLEPLVIADRLLQDENDLVLKWYGWMLKALSQVDQPAESAAPFDRALKGMTRKFRLWIPHWRAIIK